MTFGFYAPFFQPTGYAVAAHMDALGLHEAGADFVTCPLAPHGAGSRFHGFSDDIVTQHIGTPTGRKRLIRHVPTAIPVADGLDVAYAPFYEAERWPAEWVLTINTRARLCIVPNEWQRIAAVESGVEVPVRVVPVGFDWTPTAPSVDFGAPLHRLGPAALGGEAGTLPGWRNETPLVLWDGAFYSRKNLVGALRAFWTAFRSWQARLFIRCTVYRADHVALLRQVIWELEHEMTAKLGYQLADVEWTCAPLSHEVMQQLYQKASAYLTLARSEGVGYGALIAAGWGVPVVASDIPAHRVTVPEALLVGGTRQAAGPLIAADPVTRSGLHIGGLDPDHVWLDADIEEAATQLRVALRPEAALHARHVAARVARVHDTATIGHQLKTLMEAM